MIDPAADTNLGPLTPPAENLMPAPAACPACGLEPDPPNRLEDHCRTNHALTLTELCERAAQATPGAQARKEADRYLGAIAKHYRHAGQRGGLTVVRETDQGGPYL